MTARAIAMIGLVAAAAAGVAVPPSDLDAFPDARPKKKSRTWPTVWGAEPRRLSRDVNTSREEARRVRQAARLATIIAAKVIPCGPECVVGYRHQPTAQFGPPCPNACAKVLDCGGHCCLDRHHVGGCECIGDNPGEPDTCPA